MTASRKAKFRAGGKKSPKPESPKDLFLSLPRAADVPYLWDHQGAILDAYVTRHSDTRDIALELPTGTGKTLIGLLLAEYRRRVHGDRVAYLCPTRQLAHQVGAMAEIYGIKAPVSIPPAYEGVAKWLTGKTAVITTYAAIFNANPRFAHPNALVLDDAHAGEDYVASHWTVEIPRSATGAYRQLLELLSPTLDDAFVERLHRDDPLHRRAVDLVPTPRWWQLADAIRSLLDEALAASHERFAWQAGGIRERLAACNLLVGWDKIVIRPVIPPTLTHRPFAEARQRIYMSATLGAGGELERAFGVRHIERLPAPSGWESHSAGRRLFLMPHASLPPNRIERLAKKAMRASGRSLVLCPTSARVEERRAELEQAGIPTMTAGEIEESIDAFSDEDRAALVLANRYDGIDLPGNVCRLIVLDGVPVAVNLLERFLYTRLSAASLLTERMRTRFSQGVGRCSRSPSDFCAVIVATQAGFDLCARRELRELLHPELQAEVEFGLDQSDGRDHEDELLDLLETFMDQGEEWEEANEIVEELRSSAVQRVGPSAAVLGEAVRHEVDYLYDLWAGNYPRSLNHARSVIDRLSGDDLAAYRAWWTYLAGTSAWLAQEELGMDGQGDVARVNFARASQAVRTVSWFAELAYAEAGQNGSSDVDRQTLRAVERIHGELRRLGFVGPTFERRVAKMRDNLAERKAAPFEQGLEELGRLLGFDAERPGEDAAPDGVWTLSGQSAITLEAKSDASPDGAIGRKTTQQAAGHPAWIKDHGLPDEAEILAVLITDQEHRAKSATPHTGDVRVVSTAEIREAAEEIVAALARVRSNVAGPDDPTVRDRLTEELTQGRLRPRDVIERFGCRRLDQLSAV